MAPFQSFAVFETTISITNMCQLISSRVDLLKQVGFEKKKLPTHHPGQIEKVRSLVNQADVGAVSMTI